ncbi:phospholipid scramblase 1 [Salarias fasciatus]|uniref:phospholipid scramblase 1 n=1 Tax=Salarias fasciatus TaxID=181472 RepID=UPI00117698B2|nr:phospholipid scramblase 1-like [Salarias fasciatus]
MTAVSSQPLSFGGLEREKHIQMVFKAFQKRCGPSCEFQAPSAAATSCLRPADGALEELQAAAGLQEQSPPAAAPFLSELEPVSRIQIFAKPDLQGPQCVSRRTYSISTGSSAHTLVAVEESSCLCVQCCGPARQASLLGFDRHGQQIFLLERPLRVDACCLGCCLMEMRAYSPQRRLVGTVRQRWSMFTPLLEVLDSEGASALRIQGSCCPCRCFSSQTFQIVSSLGEQVGAIWKKWPGFSEEQNMDHEYFGLEVTPSIKPHIKLLLLAAAFLLNHMFFEMS